jgi:hypothetical protein
LIKKQLNSYLFEVNVIDSIHNKYISNKDEYRVIRVRKEYVESDNINEVEHVA